MGGLRRLRRTGRVRAGRELVAGLRQLRHPVTDVQRRLRMARLRVLRRSGSLLAGPDTGLRELRLADLPGELHLGRMRRAGRMLARFGLVAGVRQLRHAVPDLYGRLQLARLRRLRGRGLRSRQYGDPGVRNVWHPVALLPGRLHVDQLGRLQRLPLHVLRLRLLRVLLLTVPRMDTRP